MTESSSGYGFVAYLVKVVEWMQSGTACIPCGFPGPDSAGISEEGGIVNIVAEKSINGKTLRLVQGDITERDTDAIVNAANSSLKHGGGVAGAIVRRGGRIIQEESDRIGHVPVGNAAITTAGSLPAKYVIHAVGPRMGEGDEDNKLKSAVISSLQIAAEKGLRSISIPAISSGIFGFPKDRCATILVREAADYFRKNQRSSLEVVEFCAYDDETVRFFRNEFEKPEGIS